jgi:transcriptional regulator with XRE-family HTH domain
MTQEQVARRIGVAFETYGRLERSNKLPVGDTLVNLSKLFGVPTDVLAGLVSDDASAEHSHLRDAEIRYALYPKDFVVWFDRMSPKTRELLFAFLASFGRDLSPRRRRIRKSGRPRNR